jgi:hypothetical protein
MGALCNGCWIYYTKSGSGNLGIYGWLAVVFVLELYICITYKLVLIVQPYSNTYDNAVMK